LLSEAERNQDKVVPSSYPFHKVIERVEGKVEVEGLHRVEQPLRVQIGPPNSRPEHPVEMDTSKGIPLNDIHYRFFSINSKFPSRFHAG